MCAKKKKEEERIKRDTLNQIKLPATIGLQSLGRYTQTLQSKC